MHITSLFGQTYSRVFICLCDVEDPTLLPLIWYPTFVIDMERHLILIGVLPFIYYGSTVISKSRLHDLQLHMGGICCQGICEVTSLLIIKGNQACVLVCIMPKVSGGG